MALILVRPRTGDIAHLAPSGTPQTLCGKLIQFMRRATPEYKLCKKCAELRDKV